MVILICAAMLLIALVCFQFLSASVRGYGQLVEGPLQASQLIDEAIRLLASHENHMLDASAQEARKTNPTEIIESLGKESDLLNEQARRLENHASEGEDRGLIDLAARLRTAADSLTSQGQEILVRMYKNKDVLDIMRLKKKLDFSLQSMAEIGSTARRVSAAPILGTVPSTSPVAGLVTWIV